MEHQGLQPEKIAVPAKTRDLAQTDGRDDRGMAERFAGIHVGEVYLYRGQFGGRDGVPDGVAVVRVGPRIDEQAIGPSPRIVDGVDNAALVVGLE